MAARDPLILVTAFEPSGDAHAAPMIARLLAERPGLRIMGLGGPKMAAAGCELIETTAENAAMGIDALAKIRWMRGIVARMQPWLDANPVALHVPVDSPAANIHIVRLTRARGAGVIHLVAPQMWAWGAWRVRKLRPLTDGLMCLLPFEPAWFAARGIPARFIGHPRLDRTLDPAELAAAGAALGLVGGAPADAADAGRRIVVLPGSRPKEVERNGATLLRVAGAAARRAAARGEPVQLVAAPTSRAIADRLAAQWSDLAGGSPDIPLTTHVGQLDPVLHGADLAVAVSGTVSLDVVRHGVPMVGVFRVSRASALIARGLLRAPYRLLPNLALGEAVVPEFVPWAGPDAPIVAAADEILADDAVAAAQREAMSRIRDIYAGHDPDAESAAIVLGRLDGAPFPAEAAS